MPPGGPETVSRSAEQVCAINEYQFARGVKIIATTLQLAIVGSIAIHPLMVPQPSRRRLQSSMVCRVESERSHWVTKQWRLLTSGPVLL